MGSLCDFLENELLDHIFNAAYTPPLTVYLALSTADPTDAGSGIAEPSGNGYIRKAITFSAAASRVVTQNAIVTFDQATGSWGTITHWALYTAESAGSIMAHGALSTSKSVVNGNTPSVANGEVTVTVSAGEVSNYLANILLDFAFRNQAFTAPDTYIALMTADALDSDTGSTITEVSGGSYARKQVNVNGGSSPTWDLAASGALDNTHDIEFVTATASWGTVTACAILDALTAGNLLFYENAITDQLVGIDDSVEFVAGALDVSLD